MAEGRPRSRAAAAIVAGIVALGLLWTVTTLLGGDDTGSPPAVAATAAPQPSTSGQASVCGLPGVELSGTLDSAPAAQWTLVGTTAAPAVDGAGPGVIDADGFRSCYARTPTGALVAAANYAALGSYPPVRERFDRDATVPGPGRDALLAKPAPTRAPSTVRVQIVGFRVLRYTGDQADIDLAVRSSSGAVAGVALPLRWAQGDWKIPVADDGSDLATYTQLSDVSGYIPWAGA